MRHKSFIQKFSNETLKALVTAGFCLYADAYRETRESGTGIVTAGTLSIMFPRSGNERQRESRKREALPGSLVACVSAHLDFRPIANRGKRPLYFPLFCAILASNPGVKPAKPIDRHDIYLAGAPKQRVPLSLTMSLSRVQTNGI